MKTKLDDLMNCVLTHEHGGNGWLICQDLGDDYVKIVGFSFSKEALSRQAFLAWTKKLSIEQCLSDPNDTKSPLVNKPIPLHLRDELNELRSALKSGAKTVKDSWI